MRFLIFNGVVIAALVYLFTADRDDLQTAAHTAIDTAQSAATEVVAATRDRIEHGRLDANEAEARVTAEAAPEPEPIDPEPMAEASPDPVAAPEAQTETIAEPPAPADVAETPEPMSPPPGQPVEAPEPKQEQPVSPTRVAAANPAPPPVPEQWVPERETATVDYDTARTRLPTDDPAALRRRAEVLGEGEVSESASAAAKPRGEYAIAEGETLMTPRQRRTELHHLAEDMELLFIDKLSK